VRPLKADVQTAELRAFVAVVGTASFSRAAEQLGMSQPTISLRVKSLEDRLGIRLLDRQNGVVPTVVGRGIYYQARKIIEGLDEIGVAASRARQLEVGHLRLGFSTPHVAMAALKSFSDRYPSVTLDLHQRNSWALIDDLNACSIDVAVLTLDNDSIPGIACRLLEEQHLAAIVPVGHDLAGRADIGGSDVSEHPVIVQRQPSMTRTMVDRAMERHGVAPARVLEVPRREALRDAVLARLGVGFLFRAEIGNDTRLAHLDLPNGGAPSGVYVACLSEAAGLAVVDAFVDCALEISAAP
jgi:DNA-binding transcriptional LysR family regulator